MPLTNVDTALRDIAAAIEIIERSTASMDCDDFREDPKTIAAVERNLEAISEAAIRLGEDAEHRCPGPQWRDIRGMAIGCRRGTSGTGWRPFGRSLRTDLPTLKATVLQTLDTPAGSSAG